jgi:hypothetical protein
VSLDAVLDQIWKVLERVLKEILSEHAGRDDNFDECSS